MNNFRLRSVFFLPGLAALINVSSMGTLKDLSRPYLGTYDCEYIRMGSEDLLKKFDYVTAELKPEGIFKIEFKDLRGVKGLYRGHYVFDESDGTIKIDESIFGKRVTKSFSAENGEIIANLLYGDKLLAIKFKIR